MTSITLNVTGARIHAAVNGPLTSGMVGIPVTIRYDDAWSGLTKNLVCRCGKWGPDKGETRTVLNIGETATVAHEVMQAGMHLYLGVEGYSADGKLVIPTTWADCGAILHGANAGEDPSADPKLSVWAQLQAEIEQIKQDAVEEERIAAAVAAYLEENPIDGSDFAQKEVVDTTLTVEGAAADAQAVGDAIAEEAQARLGMEDVLMALQNSAVKSVNGTAPDADGNVEIIISDSSQNPNQGALHSFNGKTLLVTGDSITERNFRADTLWHDYLKSWCGFASVKNDGRSGSGLVKNNGIVYRLANWDNQYGEFDIILIMGNMNDGTTGDGASADWIGLFEDNTDDKKAASLYGALHYTMQTLIAKYPNKPIGWIISTPRSQIGDRGKCWGVDGWFEEWVTVIKKVCNHYSIPVLDLYHESNLRPWNADNNKKYFSCSSSPDGDGIHPNSLGQEVMAKIIYPWLNQYMRPNFGDDVPEFENIPATGITLSASALAFSDSASQTLSATVEPSDSTDSVVWSSDDEDVATVTNGVVKSLSNGSATITATAGSVSATCSVTVEMPEEEPVTLSSISVTYSGGDVSVGTTLNELTGVVVTATCSDGSTSNVTGYTLSGEIAKGANTITVSYEGLSDTFTVNGVVVATSITATYTGGEVTEGTALTDLTGITVIATYSDGSIAEVTDYALSGAITIGQNTITVTYDGLKTTFVVAGTEIDYGDALYPLVNGSATFPTGSLTVEVTDGNHVKIVNNTESTNTSGTFLNFTNVLSETIGSPASVNNQEKIFSLAYGDVVKLKVSGNLIEGWAFGWRVANGSSGISELVKNVGSSDVTGFTKEATVTADYDVGSMFVYGGTIAGNTYEFDVSLIVNNQRYI